QVHHAAAGAGQFDGVHGVVGVVGGVVLGAGGNHRAVDQGAVGDGELLQYAAQHGAFTVEFQAQLFVDEIALSAGGRAVSRQALLVVAGGTEEVELPTGSAEQ